MSLPSETRKSHELCGGVSEMQVLDVRFTHCLLSIVLSKPYDDVYRYSKTL